MVWSSLLCFSVLKCLLSLGDTLLTFFHLLTFYFFRFIEVVEKVKLKHIKAYKSLQVWYYFPLQTCPTWDYSILRLATLCTPSSVHLSLTLLHRFWTPQSCFPLPPHTYVHTYLYLTRLLTNPPLCSFLYLLVDTNQYLLSWTQTVKIYLAKSILLV